MSVLVIGGRQKATIALRNIFYARVLRWKRSKHLKEKEKCSLQNFRCGTKCGKRFSFRLNLLFKICLVEQKNAPAVSKEYSSGEKWRWATLNVTLSGWMVNFVAIRQLNDSQTVGWTFTKRCFQTFGWSDPERFEWTLRFTFKHVWGDYV